MFTAVSQARAEELSILLTEARRGDIALSQPLGIVTRYVAAKYGNGQWGVIERWAYADDPALAEFGGEFTWCPEDCLHNCAKRTKRA